jgi:high-affinity iron transporter
MAMGAAAMADHTETLDPSRVAQGHSLYLANCAVCHGADARGDGPNAKNLNPPPVNLVEHVPHHTDAELLGWITNGIPTTAMPAFGGKLSPDERESLLQYLRQLSQSTPAGATPPP